MTTLSPRFGQAFVLALEFHSGQARKVSGVPFMSHLMSVCALALEAGCDEDTAIACLLHDAIEDAGGDYARQIIITKFGERVARIVEECTETDLEPKPPWKERKDYYLSHLTTASDEARLVALCDKVHNLRITLQDLHIRGKDAWDVFNAGREDQLWWYRSLAKEFEKTPSELQVEFSTLVSQLDNY